MSNWQEMFEKGANSGAKVPIQDHGPEETEWAPPPDPNEYKPWISQRGGRPALFIDLRRFEPKTGAVIGCLMSYPALACVDYIGDRSLSLNFGMRHFILEGVGLDALAARIQQGSILAVQEFSEKMWKSAPPGPIIHRLVKIDSTPQ